MRESPPTLPGLHHVTAITANAQANIDFYSGVLGMRLVKLTVNFDDPGSYHLYYGDELGRPGTIMTFFAWPGAGRGRVGPPQVTATSLAVPEDSLPFWTDRLKLHRVITRPIVERFGEKGVCFTDPDGMQLELVGVAHGDGQPSKRGPVASQHGIHSIHGVTISEEGHETTARLMTEVMGFKAIGRDQNRFRYQAGKTDGQAAIVDLLCVPGAPHGNMGPGAVHHVAFRTPDDSQQTSWHRTLTAAGMNVSPVMDRTYFHSIYFREPGGVLFEIATDAPGFTVDQSADALGKKLILPSWLEKHRTEIEHNLTKLRLKN